MYNKTQRPVKVLRLSFTDIQPIHKQEAESDKTKAISRKIIFDSGFHNDSIL